MFYGKEDNLVKLVSVESLPAECLFVKINSRKENGWFACKPQIDNVNNTNNFTNNMPKIRTIIH